MKQAMIIGKGPSAVRMSGHEPSYTVCALNGAVNLCDIWLGNVVIAFNDYSALGEFHWKKLFGCGAIFCPEYIHMDTSGTNLIHNACLFKGLLDRLRYKVYTYNLHTARHINKKVKSYGTISSVAESSVCMLHDHFGITHFILNGIGPEPGYHREFDHMSQVKKKPEDFERMFKQLKIRMKDLGCTWEMHKE